MKYINSTSTTKLLYKTIVVIIVVMMTGTMTKMLMIRPCYAFHVGHIRTTTSVPRIPTQIQSYQSLSSSSSITTPTSTTFSRFRHRTCFIGYQHQPQYQPMAVRPMFRHGKMLFSSSSTSNVSENDTTTTTTTTDTTTTTPLPSIETMKISELKTELESYGISTKSFLEKKELIAALTKARMEGLKPKMDTEPTTTTTSTSTTNDDVEKTSTSSSNGSDDTKLRSERIQEELIKCQSMKASELKEELIERGIDCKSFLEKKEFVQALAQARVDGITKKHTKTTSSDEEGYAEYDNVEVLTDDTSGPRQKKGQQDTTATTTRNANPFSGIPGMGGIPGMAGLGGMGGVVDMLNRMGSTAAGGSPFANFSKTNTGAGGGGGGGSGTSSDNAFQKAQQLMSNPKIRSLMTKAQSNPQLMKKINECLSNPTSIFKYQNDPELVELIIEMKKAADETTT